jgi:tellurite resistance protein
MTTSSSTPDTSTQLSPEQVQTWLRGLLTLAWADGDFDAAEQELVASITHHELTAKERSQLFQPVTNAELQSAFGADGEMAENFLRTAVMVAIADGVYTSVEDDLLAQFCQALGASTTILESLRSTLIDRGGSTPTTGLKPSTGAAVDPLQPVRVWLDGMSVQDPKVAKFLCKLIPSQCPFERDVVLFGKKIVHIPPMCKLNPLYEQLVGLRFRALSYLADDCGEDVSSYI